MSGPGDMIEVERVELTAEEKRRRRSRSIAIGVLLAATVALFYVVTLAKLGSNIMDRPL